MTNQPPPTAPKKKFNIALFGEAVELFDQICARRNTRRSERISELMYTDIRLLGTPEEVARLEEILANAPRTGPKPKR